MRNYYLARRYNFQDPIKQLEIKDFQEKFQKISNRISKNILTCKKYFLAYPRTIFKKYLAYKKSFLRVLSSRKI